MPKFTSDLIVKAHPDGVLWQLQEPLTYESGIGAVTVPRGAFTDFASVPRLFWVLFPPTGRYVRAAVLHDHCYTVTGPEIARRTADALFIEAMALEGVPAWKRWVMYAAVRAFGWMSFKKP